MSHIGSLLGAQVITHLSLTGTGRNLSPRKGKAFLSAALLQESFGLMASEVRGVINTVRVYVKSITVKATLPFIPRKVLPLAPDTLTIIPAPSGSRSGVLSRVFSGAVMAAAMP